MTSDIVTFSDAARRTRLPRIARKLSAVTLLAVAFSFVRPSERPGIDHSTDRQVTGWAAPATDDFRPQPQVALLYREHDGSVDVSVAPLPRNHLLGSLARQVI
jgi:hypothetical protein